MQYSFLDLDLWAGANTYRRKVYVSWWILLILTTGGHIEQIEHLETILCKSGIKVCFSFCDCNHSDNYGCRFYCDDAITTQDLLAICFNSDDSRWCWICGQFLICG